MSVGAEVTGASGADLTHARREVKFLVPREHLMSLSTGVIAHLPLHTMRSVTDSAPPLNGQSVTTVYFDTSDSSLFHLADGTVNNVKLRARQYDAVHPDLRALAKQHGPDLQNPVWLEVKHRRGDQTAKQRAPVPAADVVGFVTRGVRSPAMEVIVGALPGVADALDELQRFVSQVGEPLAPACVVHYVRSAWQAADSSVRVTVDADVEFFAPHLDVWARRDLTDRRSLGVAVGRQQACVVEVKVHRDLPEWLRTLLTKCDATTVDYSKFVAAMQALRSAR